MASPPEAHNATHGHVYGQLLQARDIHGSVTVNAPQTPPEVTDVSLDPPRLATAVRGREELLTTLRAAMVRGAPVPHVLTGPGGFGKTTVAAALAEHARSEGWAVFWVHPNAIGPSMLEAAIEVGGSRREAEQVKGAPRQAARWAWRHLDSAPAPWLLVIDNADRPEELDPEHRPGEQRGWMRSSPGGFVLVTSRVDDPALWGPTTMHRVEVLNPEDAAVTLADHAGVGELPGATELAERLAGVPLALSLAGRILATHQILFPNAQALLSRLEEDVTELDELAAPPVTGVDGERKLLSGVWDLSLRLVGERRPWAEPLLELLALLGSEGREIPTRRLSTAALRGGVLETPGAPVDDVSLVRTLNDLALHGLVTIGRPRGEPVVKLHPLVAETITAGLGTDDLPLLDQVQSLLSHQREHDPELEAGAHSLVLRHRVRLSPEERGSVDRAVESAMAAGMTYSQEILRSYFLVGRYEEAETFSAKWLARCTEDFGPMGRPTLRFRHLLAEVRMEQGRITEAEAEYRKLVELGSAHHGPEHEVTLEARFMLALIALRREEWEEAATGFRTVVESGDAEQGAEDRRVLFARENLAYIAMRRGDHPTAEREFLSIRRARSHALGEHHFLTAQADFYLGRVAFEAGDPERAHEPFLRCLKVRERAFGTDHPDTRLTRTWLERIASAPS